MKRMLSTVSQKWPEYIQEILVLVICIYGAFALDNWNEERKRSKFERETLSQILINLKEDQDALSNIRTNFQYAFQSTEKILAIPTGKHPDSLKYWLGTIVRFDRFQPLTNAYEVLKFKGLDNLLNKDLTFKLGTY